MTHTTTHIIIERAAAQTEGLCEDFDKISPNQAKARLAELNVDMQELKRRADAEQPGRPDPGDDERG